METSDKFGDLNGSRNLDQCPTISDTYDVKVQEEKPSFGNPGLIVFILYQII